MTIKTLHDVAALRPLARVADKLAIELVLFGSVATRVALRDRFEIPTESLFEVTEHVADIDLAFLGPGQMLETVRSAIADEVPMAPWFRWSIADRAQFEEHLALNKSNWKIPLRTVRIGSDPSRTHLGPLRDLDAGLRGTFGENPEFGESGRAKVDTELSATFLYIDTLLDLLEVNSLAALDDPVRFEPSTVQASIREGLKRLARLDDDGRALALRRLWYRMTGVVSRASPSLFDHIIERMELQELMMRLTEYVHDDERLQRLSDSRRPLTVSASILPERYRLAPAPTGQDPFAAGPDSLDKALTHEDGSVIATLAPGNAVIASVRRLKVSPGKAPSSARSKCLPQEFAHISIPFAGSRFAELRPEDLTAVAVGGRNLEPVLLPAYAVVSRSLANRSWLGARGDHVHRDVADGRWTIRLNLPAMLESMQSLDVFLIAREPSNA